MKKHLIETLEIIYLMAGIVLIVTIAGVISLIKLFKNGTRN
tara:strand:+ start:996 stop:1118 length:123 start_codon:yes stop_codon:yes gene_type:complete